MVKQLFLFLIVPVALFAAEFTATVDRNQVNLGESLTLNLTLKEVSAKEPPSLNDLKTKFTLSSQQQFSNTTILNGKMSSSVVWKVVLLPKNEGDTTIPSIHIATTEGVLSSSPITIQVVKEALSAGQDSSEVDSFTLTTALSNANPYKNEPLLYTVTLTTKKDIANIKVSKFEVEEAIVETNGEPKIYEKVVDGVHLGVIEFSYLITPLKAGTLTIPSLVIYGVIPTRKNIQRGSFFDDDFNPFSMMGGLDYLKPFAQMTEEKVVEVKPPVPDVNPWLLAKSLKVEEIWSEPPSLQVGEPFTRGFKIMAEGVSSSRLPSLNDLQIKDNTFKIYADKPVLGEEIKEGKLKSHRTEHYTLIPQHSGTMTLPEISLAWWNTEKNEKVVTLIPQRTLQILPAPEQQLTIATWDSQENERIATPDIENDKAGVFIYVMISLLAGLLVAAVIWIIVLQKKIAKFTRAKVNPKKTEPSDYSRFANPKNPKKSQKEKLPDLNPS